MNVTCPNCATVYRVDPAKVPEGGVRARCAVCSAVFGVARETAAETVATPPVSAAPSPAVAPTQPPPPVSEVAPVAEMRAAAESRAPAGRPVAPPARALAAPPATPGAAVRATAPIISPAAAPAPPAAPAVPVTPAAAMRPPVAAPTRPVARAVNPFLSQDPSLKARRLARALISDMVVYHPGKRKDGLRNGNLKELFDDEIKKSWEEYTEQVGKDVAESTTFFRDALNEILADGQQVF